MKRFVGVLILMMSLILLVRETKALAQAVSGLLVDKINQTSSRIYEDDIQINQYQNRINRLKNDEQNSVNELQTYNSELPEAKIIDAQSNAINPPQPVQTVVNSI